MLYIIVCDATIHTNAREYFFNDFIIRDDSINAEEVKKKAERRVGKKESVMYVKLHFKSCVGITSIDINMPDQEFNYEIEKRQPTKAEKRQESLTKESRQERLENLKNIFE